MSEPRQRYMRLMLALQFVATELGAMGLYLFVRQISLVFGVLAVNVVGLIAIVILKQRISPFMREMTGMTAIVLWAMVGQVVALQMNDTSSFWVLQIAVILQPFVLTTGVQSRFVYGLIGCSFMSAFLIVTDAIYSNVPVGALFALVVLTGCCGTYALFTAFKLETQERGFFLEARRSKRRAHELESANARLAELSTTDGLTGIANRRGIEQFYDAQTARIGIGLILVDVDYFKPYNDHYGHNAGDDCLRFIADALTDGIRTHEDRLGRWGGEEFMVVLRTDNADDCRDTARRLRTNVEALHMRHEHSAVARHVTISAGYVHRAPGEQLSLRDLSRQADMALYAAKGAGRNQVFGYEDWAGQANDTVDEAFIEDNMTCRPARAG